MKNLFEHWTPIKNFENYHINKLGNVFSCLSNKFIKQQISNRGYARVWLYKNGKVYVRSIHRIMAESFLSNPEKLPEVNHKDGNKSNNIIDNLEWSTGSDNIKHAYNNGLRNLPLGESNPNNKLSEKEVMEIKSNLKNYKYGMCSKLARKYNVCQQTISDIKLGRIWRNK